MLQIDENTKNVLLGVYEHTPQTVSERYDILSYYSFYNGAAKNEECIENPVLRGQSWETSKDLDYKPTQEIRNHTKKLLQKQQRFMFGQSPNVLVKAYDEESRDNAEGLRQFIDDILEEGEYWNETFKAFLDCTIGKRVLLLLDANPGEPIKFKYFTADQFTFKCSKENYKELEEVIIAYTNDDTETIQPENQVWHKWKYYMNGETCILEKADYDGNAKLIPRTQTIVDTKIREIPARVIVNGGLLGETMGTSDVADLIPIADSYNRRMSDFADALRFKMFEQPVFINASQDSIQSIKIAPNALIDLKATPTQENTTPDAKMLTSTFSFKDSAEYYLDKALSDMYELMDQPRPEDIKNVPSAKAIKFIFYDLMARCEEKWKTWEPAILWAINTSLELVEQFNLYPENSNRQFVNIDARISLVHNYPIPEDVESKKKLAMQEVSSHVRSRKSYMRDYSELEDENDEFNEILEEMRLLNSAERDTFEVEMNNTLDNLDKEVNQNGSNEE